MWTLSLNRFVIFEITEGHLMKQTPFVVPLLLAVLLFCVPARAAFFSIEPSDPLFVAPGQTASFELIFNPETDGAFTIIGWDLEFIYDTTEMTFDNVVDDLGLDPLGPIVDETGNLLSVSVLADFEDPGSTFVENTSQTLATFEFTMTGLESFDGISDFELLSQIGTVSPALGLLMDDEETIMQYLGEEGADISAVPLPDPLWMLLAGMASLAGVHRFRLR